MGWVVTNGKPNNAYSMYFFVLNASPRLIWAICGTGYLLDVMWAVAFGLAVSNLQRELGFSDKQFGNLGSSFSAGVTAGAFVWGVLVDVIGGFPIKHYLIISM